MKNIHIIPTDKPSRLYRNISEELSFTSIEFTQQKNGFNINQNIYITSDEEIKEGYHVFNTKSNHYGGVVNKNNLSDARLLSYIKKIILTDNQDLIKCGVQAIDDEFLEWFVKNPSCEYVEVKKFFGFAEDYLIIIPKEEPKQDCECKDECLGYLTKDCKRIEQPKQEKERGITITHVGKKETLEEVAERFYGEEEIVNDYDISGYLQSAFLTGAKWQQERSYTLEQISELFIPIGKNGYIDDYLDYRLFNKEQPKLNFKEWFEQFKKK
jgi:hypothetical protein